MELQPAADGVKYPLSIFFILGNEFCERFNFYGLKTILSIYLVDKLSFTEDDATTVFHLWTAGTYFMCCIGAIIADSLLGKYHVIWSFSIVYMIGTILLAISSVPGWGIPEVELCFVALVLIAIGSGGIKPCVSAFGGEQFNKRTQMKQLQWFYSMFYFAINLGSVISTLVTPILRHDVRCFHEEDCYPLAFFVPSVLMVVSLVLFVVGTKLYKIIPPKGHVIVEVCTTIWDGIVGKIKRDRSEPPKKHFLEYAAPKHSDKQIYGTKVMLRILLLYLPLPVFWSLFDQQGSRWTFQARRMNGTIGSYRIKPDQMLFMNPVLILIFIPLTEFLLYPALKKILINTPLRKLVVGGCLAGFAFIASFLLEGALTMSASKNPPAGTAHIRIYNGMPCSYDFETNLPNVPEYFEPLEFIPSGSGGEGSKERCMQEISGTLTAYSGMSIGYFLETLDNKTELVEFDDDPEQPYAGDSRVRILSSFAMSHLVHLKKPDLNYSKSQSEWMEGLDIVSGAYRVFVDDKFIKCDQDKTEKMEIELGSGAVYNILLDEFPNEDYLCRLIKISDSHSIHILWQTPQYMILTLGEIMYSVTGLQFSFTQAPVAMRSMIAACWLMTVAFGNLLVVIFSSSNLFENQMWEYLMFAILIWIDMAVFAFLAWRYKPIDEDED